ncbi:Urease accessory protein [Cenarchaeum symbiosum A]|uniref:Urease accessory protein n=1 Tax=Cenarchaeum symbiosum (strain A) TaxID=414004 RepID=A0RUR9_CENSY|nr:Urease accessory protein [Cenarchaeum symbiosum A]
MGELQLSDSLFPSGMFAHSNGLEYMINSKAISDAGGLYDVIEGVILQQVGPLDCAALGSTYSFIKDGDYPGIAETDRLVHCSKLVAGQRDASARSGAQAARCVAEFAKDDTLDRYVSDIGGGVHGAYPVAFALCCNALGVQKERAAVMLLYGYASGSVSAALRMGLIDHVEGQGMIHRLKPAICSATKELNSTMWQFSPRMDIMQMLHEKTDSKMFIT